MPSAGRRTERGHAGPAICDRSSLRNHRRARGEPPAARLTVSGCHVLDGGEEAACRFRAPRRDHPPRRRRGRDRRRTRCSCTAVSAAAVPPRPRDEEGAGATASRITGATFRAAALIALSLGGVLVRHDGSRPAGRSCRRGAQSGRSRPERGPPRRMRPRPAERFGGNARMDSCRCADARHGRKVHRGSARTRPCPQQGGTSCQSKGSGPCRISQARRSSRSRRSGPRRR